MEKIVSSTPQKNSSHGAISLVVAALLATGQVDAQSGRTTAPKMSQKQTEKSIISSGRTTTHHTHAHDELSECLMMDTPTSTNTLETRGSLLSEYKSRLAKHTGEKLQLKTVLIAIDPKWETRGKPSQNTINNALHTVTDTILRRSKYFGQQDDPTTSDIQINHEKPMVASEVIPAHPKLIAKWVELNEYNKGKTTGKKSVMQELVGFITNDNELKNRKKEITKQYGTKLLTFLFEGSSGRDENNDGYIDPVAGGSGASYNFDGIYKSGDNIISNDMFIGTRFDETAENMKGFESYKKDRLGTSYTASVSGLFVHELTHLLQNGGHPRNANDVPYTDADKRAGKRPMVMDNGEIFGEMASDCYSHVAVGQTLRYAIQDYNVQNPDYKGPISQIGNKIRGKFMYQGKAYDLTVPLGGATKTSSGVEYTANNIGANMEMTAEEKFAFIVRWSQVYGTAQTTATNDRFEKLRQMVSIFPNPVEGITRISLASEAGATRIRGVQLSSIDGKLMPVVAMIGDREVELNLSTLPAGTYLARIITNDGSVTKKIMKQ